jgi:hypothetical protein
MGTPFVGRRRELDSLAEAGVEAASGRPRLIAIWGDPGVGKTFLAERAAEQAEAAGFRVVWGRCWPHGGAPPLWPWQPMLAELLGSRGELLLADDPGDERVDPERFARFAAVADRLRAAAREQPLMLVIDDVHAADAGALLLVRFVVRTLDRSALLILLIRRSGEDALDPALVDLVDSVERDATVMPLAPFDLRETIALLSTATRHDLDPATLITLTRVTGGNPLLLARAIAAGAPGTRGSPVLHAISGAIDDLPVDARRVLGVAATIGTRATVREICSVRPDLAGSVGGALRLALERALIAVDRELITFEHDLIRDAALDALADDDRLAVHAAMTRLLEGDPRIEQTTRRARHALAASSLSDDHAATAVDAAADAARAMRRGFGHEGAAAMFADAIAVSAHLPPRRDWASIPVEHAEMVLVCGRLGEARELFAGAVDRCERDGDSLLLARAAIGLGGLWLNEHRDPVEHHRMLAVQRRALAGLGDDHPDLRSRLSTRLAAEAVYEGGSVDLLREALDAARRCGDGTALAEALSLSHHALMAPGAGRELLPLADELIAVASASGEGLLALMGLMWRTVDLFQMQRTEAERSLAELRRRVDAIGCRSLAYIVATIDVMRLIREGRLDEAESAASAAYERGVEVGDADATGYYAAHLLTIRFLQGRDGELLDLAEEVATSPTVMMRERGLRASAAGIAARSGDVERARTILGEMGVDDIAPSSTSLVALAGLADVALALGDAELGRRVYDALEPHAALPLVPSLAVTCLGSTERPLGLAALAFGDPQLAVAHFERALVGDEQLAHRPMVAVAKAELGRALVAAGDSSERPRTLLASAIEDAEAMRLTGRRADWMSWIDRLGAERSPAVLSVERAGANWVVTSGPRRADVPHLIGMQYLKALVDRPGEDIAATELCGASVVDGARHEMADRRTLDSYRERVREIDAEIAEADADADIGRAEKLRFERDDLREELSRVLGLGGSQRTFADSSERARTAVHKAMKRAFEAIGAVEPALGEQLRASVTTGRTCRYDPG